MFICSLISLSLPCLFLALGRMLFKIRHSSASKRKNHSAKYSLDSFAGHLSSLREWGTNIFIWYVLMIYRAMTLVGTRMQGSSSLFRTFRSAPNCLELTWRILNVPYAQQLDNHLSSPPSFQRWGRLVLWGWTQPTGLRFSKGCLKVFISTLGCVCFLSSTSKRLWFYVSPISFG